MRFNLKDELLTKLLFPIHFGLLILFLTYLTVNYFYLREHSLLAIENELTKTIDHIKSDFTFNNGEWDTTLYQQDTTTPYDRPLYIVTNEGFVLDRTKPIAGYLDTSDSKYVSQFTSPQTITSPVNISWRIYSEPIMYNGKIEGRIVVSYIKPNDMIISEIDSKLLLATDTIKKLITVNDGDLFIGRLEPKHIDYDIYFSVIDKFNNIIIEDGGPPTYIDRSIVGHELQNIKRKEVVDAITGEVFLLVSKPIQNNRKEVVGLIVLGESTKSLRTILRSQALYSLFMGVIAIIASITISIFLRKRINQIINNRADEKSREQLRPKYIHPEKITYETESGTIYFDNQPLKIEYATIQRDLCKVLFSNPLKRWERDELIEKMRLTENDVKTRTFYDACIKINKKVMKLINKKLIVSAERTFSINPELLPLIPKRRKKRT